MPRKQSAIKRRTTLTLPADSLMRAEKIARSRQVNLSTVISEVVSAGLELEDARNRKAFTGFTADQLAILDGIILEPVSAGKRR
jgi:hypothetical protein